MTKLQERVKKLRQEKGISQIELANAIEVTNDTISLWERGLRRTENKQLRMYTVKITKHGDEE